MAFDRTDPADLLALKTEVNTDPEGLGYNASLGDTQHILDTGNLIENNTAGGTVPVPWDEYPGYEVVDEIVQAEYNALSDFKKVKIDAIIYALVANPELTFGYIKVLFRQTFGITSATWIAVKDDKQRDASRFEILFGRDTVISRDDWIAARES